MLGEATAAIVGWTEVQAPPAPARDTRIRGAGSVRARLFMLAMAATLPMLLLFVGVAYLDYRAERGRAAQRELAIARSMAATVDRELRSATASLQALALSPPLQQGDIAGFRELAMRFVAGEPAGTAMVLLDSDGQHLINTMVPLGQPLPRRLASVTRTLVRPVFATGKPAVSNLFPRAIGHTLIVTADVPVLRAGRVLYDLSLVLPASRFSDILAEQHLPPQTVASVFDRNGVNVARVPDGAQFVGKAASATLLPALLARDEGVLGTLSLDGTRLVTAFSHTSPSGWSVGIGVPETSLRAPLQRALALALGAGLAGLLASSAVAYALGQRILQPIRALTRFAANPAQPGNGSFGLHELDEVAVALRYSQRDRQAAMDALQRLNEQLEARIREETASRVEAQAQLAQSQRMEALGQLAGGIAHDFNNVLQAVTGGLSLIQRRASDEEAVRRLSRMAADAASRGAAITGRLLTFARRGELSAVPIAPAALLGSLREMLVHTLGAHVDIQVDAADTLPRLCADQAQLETVLINLAINARDAMPAGGTLTLAADVKPHAPDGSPPGISLCLIDTGVGMAPDVLARASEPFFTTKDPGQGTGLGLAMARGFAEQSGGGFSIASTPGVGTTVSLWFPQAHMQAIPVGSPAEPLPAFGGETPMRVLMVDDDSMVREVLAGEMEARGFLVTTANDAAAALALLDGGQATDLLITDYAMAGMNGLALIGQARRRRPDLPALLLTGFAEARAESALSSGQDRLTVLLRKPIAGEELARQASLLRRRR